MIILILLNENNKTHDFFHSVLMSNPYNYKYLH